MFVAKALEYTLRRVVLLTVNRSVLLQNTVDDIREGGQFRAFRWLASPISRRFRMPQHLLTVSRAMPNRLAASRWLRPSTWQASRTRRHRSTVYILPPSISKKIEGYRWQSLTPPAAGKSRRFRGLICHRRSQLSFGSRGNTCVLSASRRTGAEKSNRSWSCSKGLLRSDVWQLNLVEGSCIPPILASLQRLGSVVSELSSFLLCGVTEQNAFYLQI